MAKYKKLTDSIDKGQSLRRQLIILTVSLIVIGFGLGTFIYFSFFHTPAEHLNPIFGKWRSEQAYFGDYEVLEFTPSGQVKNGRLIHTDYKMKGDDKVLVITNTGSDKYIMSADKLRMFIYKPRVGKMTYERTTPLPDELRSNH